MHAGTARVAALVSLLAAPTALPAAETSKTPSAEPTYVQVTATRVPEDVEFVPASITLVSGDDIRARGARDLASALSLVAGVSIGPGGDGGPASAVPEIWGLREFDAFLLVVDGVPWGGAFNPDLASLSLENVDRIEVVRGAAPVMYGATSFSGVIHVIHRRPGEGGGAYQVSGGSYGSGGASAQVPLPSSGPWKQSVGVDAMRLGFRDDRTTLGRGHVLYRGERPAGPGRFRLDVDATGLRQDPASPHPREGTELSGLVPLDANHNPGDARLDENRFYVSGGFDRDFDGGSLSTTLSVTDSRQNVARGFLTDLSGAAPDAEGFQQDIGKTDVYFDAHVALRPAKRVRVVAGLDHLYGRVHTDNHIFDYFVPLDGSNPPNLADLAAFEENRSRDRRNFSGMYGQVEWTPHPRLRADLGVRLNHTEEIRSVTVPSAETDSRTLTRGSGTFGLSWLAWSGAPGAVWLFGDYRNGFKPAAFDFGPDAEAEILEPETAHIYETGLKGTHAHGRVAWQFSAFQMDFSNLVVSTSAMGLPTLENAGEERFRGLEIEGTARLRPGLHVRAAYSLHDARFRDYEQDFGGTLTRLDGNRLEMSARHLASAGLMWAPPEGFRADATIDYVGSRYLDRRNRAIASPYTEWGAGVGWAFRTGEVRLAGRNLGDTRPPVSESELGDAQYYRLPARSVEVSWRQRF